MARIAGVDLPRNKQARIALTYIFGIGNPRARRILETANVDPFKKVQDLGEDEVNRIRQVIENEGQIEGDLRKDISMRRPMPRTSNRFATLAQATRSTMAMDPMSTHKTLPISPTTSCFSGRRLGARCALWNTSILNPGGG